MCVCACACEIDYVNVATHLVSKLSEICYHLPMEVVLRLIVYTCSCTSHSVATGYLQSGLVACVYV